jgi:hypothetical protein
VSDEPWRCGNLDCPYCAAFDNIPIGAAHKKYSAMAFDRRPEFGYPRVEMREYVEPPSSSPKLFNLFDKIRGQEFDPGDI